MGTEQSYPIGAVLTRKKSDPEDSAYDEVRVVGGGKQLVVTPNKEFGASRSLDANIARRDYDSDVPEGVLLAQPTYVDPGPTPEQVFAAADSNTERRPEASAWRTPRKSEDPRTEIESSKTDTGVPSVKYAEQDTPIATAEEVKPKAKSKAKADA